ncbi:uncharacterized protein GJ701_006152 [Geothlypis trichas]
MDGRMDGWTDGRMDGWMDGWMDGGAGELWGASWWRPGWRSAAAAVDAQRSGELGRGRKPPLRPPQGPGLGTTIPPSLAGLRRRPGPACPALPLTAAAAPGGSLRHSPCRGAGARNGLTGKAASSSGSHSSGRVRESRDGPCPQPRPHGSVRRGRSIGNSRALPPPVPWGEARGPPWSGSRWLRQSTSLSEV